MRKRPITPSPQGTPAHDDDWLNLDRLAVVEVTSEDKDYPVESALVAGEMRGWRASDSGTQTIRLIFDQPQRLTRIALVFEEIETTRTQEFVLRWSSDGGRSFREIVHQQWNFSPPETKHEVEEFQVALSDVIVLELIVVEGNMSPRTLFLSKLIGLYCILIGLSLMTRGQATVETVTALLQNPVMTLILGVITLAAGLAMVLAHNIWSGGALAVVVTLVGWMALIKSLFFLFLPHEMEAGFFIGQLHYRQFFYLYSAISLVLGVYLTYGGFRSTSH
jgi:hypothetical protein